VPAGGGCATVVAGGWAVVVAAGGFVVDFGIPNQASTSASRTGMLCGWPAAE